MNELLEDHLWEEKKENTHDKNEEHLSLTQHTALTAPGPA
jgi:hypothetical protein